MAIKSPTIRELTNELIARVKSTKKFDDRAFSIYDVDDLSQKMNMQTTPAVAVAYERGDPRDLPEQAVMPSRDVKPSLLYMTLTFSILIGIEYTATAETDTKPDATDLLDEVRRCLIGYKGVNGKPWRFVNEQPIGSEVRGVIWYGQLWQTDVPHESSSK